MSKKHKSKPRLIGPSVESRIVDPSRKPVNTPAVSFQYICQNNYSIKLCNLEQYKSLSDKLRIICTLDWHVIDSTPRTTHGYEKIPRKQLRVTVPTVIPTEVEIIVFRFGGGDHGGRLVGCRQGKRFYLLFVDCSYTLYDHG